MIAGFHKLKKLLKISGIANKIKTIESTVNSFLFFDSREFTPLIIINEIGIQRIKSNPSNLVKHERNKMAGINVQRIIFLYLLSPIKKSPTAKNRMSINGYLNRFKFPGSGSG